ncbi:MAG: hypothetical protein ABIR91_00925, partial [Candidatus Saccharimonadales bacterium]
MESTQPFDDRAYAYLKSGDLVTAIARQHCRVDVDTTSHLRWRQLMGLMREVDTWADDSDVSRDVVITGLYDFVLFKDRSPDLTTAATGDVVHAAVLRRAEYILQLGDVISQTTTLDDFVELRIQEAYETVNLFADTATPHVSEQAAFADDFLPTVRALGAAATLYDSMVDGKKDVQQGKQVLVPNREYYQALGKATVQQGKLGGAALLHVGPLWNLGV